jgi:hypothetical protein
MFLMRTSATKISFSSSFVSLCNISYHHTTQHNTTQHNRRTHPLSPIKLCTLPLNAEGGGWVGVEKEISLSK